MVLAVSDSDVLIHLAKLGLLKLLKYQFSNIYISETVYDETVVQGLTSQKKDAKDLQKFFKLELISIEKVNTQLIEEIIQKHHIHKGESSIIVLAKKYNVDYCLTNEIKVRNVVKSENFQVIGTLGIILKAHSIGKIKRQNCLK